MNGIYKRQFAILIFFAGVVFKLAFLPAYLTEIVANDNIFAVAVYLLFDFLCLFLIYYIAKNRVIEKLPHNLRAGIMLALFALFALKFAVMSGEVSYCISSNLFKDGHVVFVYAAIGALTSYIAVKGGGVLAKMGEIFVVAVVVCLAINLVTVESDVNFMYNLPFFATDGKSFFSALDKYYMWTGDFLPLIVFTITDGKKKSKTMPLMIALTAVTVIAHYAFLNAVFKSGAAKTDNLLVALGTFNIGNILVGRTDALSLTVWFIMAVINLALTLLAATESASYFLKDRRIGTAAVNVFTVLLYIFGLKNVSKLFDLSTGAIRYFVLAVGTLAPIVIIVCHTLQKRSVRRALEARKRL
ncbi:MAG: hypothetical protein LBQ40_02980 [Clostridiales bacterium]|jgi:hypothetical protein|nr:hypothetical protein [Clostridiales bacterium]